MKRARVAAAVVGLALLTFFWFPGHTWLQQDSQIYVPILDHQMDPLALRNDLVAEYPHDAYTLYDEVAIEARRLAGLGFRETLQAQQIAARALGIWGLVLLAEAFGLATLPAFAVAAVCSLGAMAVGPTVLTLEYEPTPRAFAFGLVLCALGLAARRRWMAASIAASVAFVYHAPTTAPFWAVFGIALLLNRRWRELAPPAIAAAVLLVASRGDGTAGFGAHLTAAEEHLQRLRASYVWVSMWPPAQIAHWCIVFAAALAAFRRTRGKDATLFVMAAIGIASIPASWLLLEEMKWALAPQIQPMRWLLYTLLAMQFFAAVAAMKASRWWEAAAWFALACLPVVQPDFAAPWAWRPVAVVLALALAASAAPAARLVAALAAFLAIPLAGGVVNYPRLHTPELASLSAWARSSTSRDAVFFFPDLGRRVEPGIFRAEAVRAVYVDWKGGGQVNYIREFGERWWFRWQQTLARKFTPDAVPRYDGLGIDYIVLSPKNRLKVPPKYENAAYLVYRIGR